MRFHFHLHYFVVVRAFVLRSISLQPYRTLRLRPRDRQAFVVVFHTA